MILCLMAVGMIQKERRDESKEREKDCGAMSLSIRRNGV